MIVIALTSIWLSCNDEEKWLFLQLLTRSLVCLSAIWRMRCIKSLNLSTYGMSYNCLTPVPHEDEQEEEVQQLAYTDLFFQYLS